MPVSETRSSPVLVAAALIALTIAPPARADVEEGHELFVLECSFCHVSTTEQKAAGPALEGVVGRQAGKVEGYVYSDAVKNSDVTWSDEMLHVYLARPQDAIAGIRSTFKGMPLAEDRAALIEYLKTLKSDAP